MVNSFFGEIVPLPLSTLPGFLLRRAASAMMAELAERLAVLDLRVSDATVLLLLGERGAMTSSEIGKALEIKSANMVPLLNRLAAVSAIERRPIDRKSQAIVLTASGRAALLQVQEITSKFEDDLLGRIPHSHREHFVPALLALLG